MPLLPTSILENMPPRHLITEGQGSNSCRAVEGDNKTIQAQTAGTLHLHLVDISSERRRDETTREPLTLIHRGMATYSL